MNTKFNMTIELTEADVKQAIAEYVTRHLQEASLEINAKDVNFDISQQYDMRNEPYGLKLNKARVQVRQRNRTHTTAADWR